MEPNRILKTKFLLAGFYCTQPPIPKKRGQWRTILYPGLFCPGYYMAKTGEQDRDGPSSPQGSDCFVLRADIIQPHDL